MSPPRLRGHHPAQRPSDDPFRRDLEHVIARMRVAEADTNYYHESWITRGLKITKPR